MTESDEEKENPERFQIGKFRLREELTEGPAPVDEAEHVGLLWLQRHLGPNSGLRHDRLQDQFGRWHTFPE